MTTITIDWLALILCVLPILIALLLSLLWLWRTIQAANAYNLPPTRPDLGIALHSTPRGLVHPHSQSRALWERLTKREREVALLAAEGKTNAEIGKALHISTSTVGNHLSNIYDKLEVNSRHEIKYIRQDIED